MVAASKMRRAEESDKASSPYTVAAEEILTHLSQHDATRDHAIFVARPIRRRLVVMIASDKGLAGGYNSNIVKRTIAELRADREAGIETDIITVGRRASQAMTRIKDVNVLGVYDDQPDEPRGGELRAILHSAFDLYTTKQVDAVDVIYTQFKSGMLQVVDTKRVLPAGFRRTKVSDRLAEATFEPDVETVLQSVAYRLVGAQIFQCYLDAKASEHAQRMVAMKNATDNASDLVDDLTLAMNKARQGAITQELAEISGGVEAMK